MKLLEELYGQGLINEQKMKDLKLEMEKSQITQDEVILKNNILDENKLFEIKSKILNIPLAKPSQKDISTDVLNLISQESSTNYKMAPMYKKDDYVAVGMVYPENILAQNALRFLSKKENFKYKVFLISFSNLNEVLKQQRTLSQETKKALTELEKEDINFVENSSQKNNVTKIIDDAPIIKMVMVIVRHAIEGKASDIHIEPRREKLNVRFRQDGILHSSLFLPLSVHSAVVSRIKILANLKIDENRVPQDGRFSVKIDGRDLDFRVATFPTLYGEKVELRVLDSSEGLKSFEQMGLRGRNLELIQTAIKSPYGLILASGPTGSGKTTTLYAFLRILNKESVNIVTIEDPIEYSIDGVNQSQVRPEIGYTFSEALRQILRQDPNVIMVGEVRDEETANLVVHSALTGHIVLSTLHTNSAVGVIPRMIDMGIRPFLIPSTLRIAISQRLVRVLCKNCKKKVIPNDKIKNHILNTIKSFPAQAKKEFKTPEPLYIYEAKGCEDCGFIGYKGRIGLFEVLPITNELIDVILKNPVESLILKAAQKQGMLTMLQEGILKVLDGETTMEEITRATQEK